MQFIGANEILGLLLDATVLVSRNQLWRNRRIDYVQQCLRSHLPGHIRDQIADQRLGHSRIHTIHRHVVTIIGSPSQGEF